MKSLLLIEDQLYNQLSKGELQAFKEDLKKEISTNIPEFCTLIEGSDDFQINIHCNEVGLIEKSVKTLISSEKWSQKLDLSDLLGHLKH